MKKLIISIVATASLALVAKADGALLNATSFENYDGDFSVNNPDSDGAVGQYYWLGGDDGSEFLIKALAGEGGLGTKSVDRPKYWADQDQTNVPDAKALAIDTDKALSRHVNADKSARDIGTGLYFDSMVQFTATDTPPDVKANDADKLVIWLKETAVTATEEGGDSSTDPTYTLCVTAGDWQEGQKPSAIVYENANSEITVRNGEWCRLTISVTEGSNGFPRFRIFINGKPFVDVNGVEEFLSLTEDALDAQTITSVSFQGKGAIDDLVWTTEDPIVAPTKSYTVIVDDSVGSTIVSAQYKIGEADEVSVSLYDGETDETADFALTVPVDATSVTFFLDPGEEYEVEDGTFDPDNERWVVTVTLPAAGSQITLKIIQKQVEEPEVAKPFTVTIAGVETPFETLAGAIEAADGAPIKLTQAATLMETLTVAEAAVIDLNGQTLTLAETDDYAVVVKAALTITDSSGDNAGKVIVPGYYGFGVGSWANDIDVAGELTIEAGTFKADVADYLIGAFIGTVNISGGVLDSCYNVLNAFGKKGDGSRVTVNISGGTFSVAETDVTGEYESAVLMTEESVTWAVSGGLFSMPLDEAFCAEGFIPTTAADDDGYYTVVRGYAVTVEAANATVTGLASKYAAGATVSFTVAAEEGYEVTSVAAEDDKATVSEANGVYSFTMPAEAVTITVVTTEIAEETPKFGDEAYDPEDVDQNGEWTAVNSSSVITVPTGWKLDCEENTITKGTVVIKIPGYYSITPAQGGGYSLALNETARPTVAAEGVTKPMEFVTEGGEEVVKLNVPNIKSRLYYSVVYADDVKFTKNMVETKPVKGAVPSAPKGTNGRFFKVVVTDVPAQN